jgi:hypothetical protein
LRMSLGLDPALHEPWGATGWGHLRVPALLAQVAISTSSCSAGTAGAARLPASSEDPRCTTKAGSKRDHFAHLNLVGGGHSPETWFHYTGKQVVGRWLRAHYPDARVQVDHDAVANGQVPDVLAVFPDGRRFAFEVQYVALTEEEWTVRHDGYVEQGFTDVWLLGHLPRYLRRRRGVDGGRYVLGPLLRQIVEAEQRLYWINPDERTIASRREITDASYGKGLAYGLLTRAGFDVELAVDALDDCVIDGASFLTPLDRIERTEWVNAEAARRRREEAEQRAESRRREEEARRSEIAVWLVRKQAQQAELYKQKTRPWVDRDLAGAVLDIEIELKSDRGIYLHPAQWHAVFFRDHIEGRSGQTFSYREACRPFMDNGKYRDGIFRAISGYLFYLARRAT